MAKQSYDIDVLKREVVDQQARSMQNNILVHDIPESRDENCAEKVKEALTKCGFTESYSVERIHRLGSIDKNASRPRPIIARLQSYRQTESVLKFGRAKRGDIKITPQFPAELRSRRRELNDIAEDMRKKDRNVKTKIAGDTLYVNGERQVDRLPRPSTQELLCASEAENLEAKDPSIWQATHSKTVDGSTFTVRAVSVSSIRECRAMYKTLLMNPKNASAAHNTAAFHLYKPNGAISDTGYTDDGEHGIGRLVRDAIIESNGKNVAVFVTRHYGGRHIGSKRFTVVKDLVKQAVASVG